MSILMNFQPNDFYITSLGSFGTKIHILDKKWVLVTVCKTLYIHEEFLNSKYLKPIVYCNYFTNLLWW